MEGIVTTTNIASTAISSAYKISSIHAFSVTKSYTSNSATVAINKCDMIIVMISYISTLNVYYEFLINFPLLFSIPINEDFTLNITAVMISSTGTMNPPTLNCLLNFVSNSVSINFASSTDGVSFGGNIFAMSHV